MSSPPPATPAADEQQNISEKEIDTQDAIATTPIEGIATANPTVESTTTPTTETIAEAAVAVIETQTETAIEPTTTTTTIENKENAPQYDVITEQYDSNQRQVNDLIASLRMDLLTARSEVATLKGKVNGLTAENIDLKIKNQGVSSFETANKLQMEQMEERLDSLKQKESEYHKKILELEQEQSLLKDQKQKQYHDHIAETSALKKERDDLTKKNINLQLELSKTAAESKSTKTEQKTFERRCKELELNRMGDAKAHEDMIAVYEKQQKESQAQLQNYIAAEARARQEATHIEERLQKENDDLKQKLAETEDRLSIIRLRSDGASPSQQQIGNTTLPDGRQSNLIQLMRQYEEGGKSWECIYEDYFELKKAHIKAVEQYESMRASNEQLMREQRDKEQRYRRMEVEHRRLNTETEAIRERARRAEAAQNENVQVINGLHDKINGLQHKNNDLEKSLNEVAYQLQHVIHDVESRNELLPAGVKSSSDLLQYASQAPGFNTEDLVFNNVKQLQEQNQKLLERIRKLDDEVKEKTRETEKLGREGLTTEEKYTLALNRAEETIKDLNYNVITLQQRLAATVKQRDMYKLGTSEVNEHAHNNIPNTQTTQSQQEESNAQNGNVEDEAYRYAMQEDMKQLQTELKEALNAATASNTRLKTTEAEIAKLRKECQNLLRSQALRSSDLKGLRTRNADLERLLADNEQNLTNYANEFAIYRQKQESLRAENITLRSQIDFSDSLHKKAIQDNESLSSRCAQLTGLLQNMTSKNKSNSGVQSDGIEFLKKQIEAQDKELENLRLRLQNAQEGLADSDIREQDHWKNKYNEVHRELQRLNGSQLELQKELAAAKEQRITLETKLSLLEKNAGNAGSGSGEQGAEGEEKEQPEGEGVEGGHGINFEAQYTELAAANMEMEKLRLQITDYEEQLEKQREEADKLSKEHDEFTTDMQSKLVKLHQELSDRDGMIKAAQTATEDIQRLKLERAEAEQQWVTAKNTLHTEKEKLEQRVKEYEEEAGRLRQQIETQTELINEGKEKLELEINSHADDTETIKSLREETNRLTQEITTANAELANLQSQLRISEESWTKQKEQWEDAEKRLKFELESSTKRFDDLLETLSAKQNDETTEQSTTESGDTPIPADVANKSDEQLQLLVVSIRQKNEMLQRQYKAALSKVDQVRSDLQFAETQVASLKAQVEVVRTQNVEIENKYQEAARKAKDEAIVYKENNTQLRATITDLRTQVSTLDKQATESKASVEPLTDKVANLEAQIKAQTETIEQLEKSKLEWSTRTAQIMSKYNKLDPAEVETAKQERDAAKAQMEATEKAKSEAESKLKELEDEKAASKKQLEEAEAKTKKFQHAALVYRKKFEEAQGQSNAGGSGASTPNAAVEQQKKELEQKKKELEELEEKLKAALEQKKSAETALQQKVAQHQELQGKHKGLLTKTRTIIEQKKTIEQSHEEALNKLREELKTSTENLNKSTQELNQQKEETKKAKEQLEEVTKEKNKFAMETQRNKVKISLDQNKITKLTKELDALKKRGREEDDNEDTAEQPAAKIQKQETTE